MKIEISDDLVTVDGTRYAREEVTRQEPVEPDKQPAKYSAYMVADDNNRRGYRDRQLFANQEGADLYLELHLNAVVYDRPDVEDNPSTVLVASNASAKSRFFAAALARMASERLDYKNGGMRMLGPGDRGYWNLYYTSMPAVLSELLYVSDEQQARLALSDGGPGFLASLHRRAIYQQFPDGCRVAISVGHMFKPSPHQWDRGAPVTKAVDNPEGKAEADICLEVAELLTKMLNGDGANA